MIWNFKYSMHWVNENWSTKTYSFYMDQHNAQQQKKTTIWAQFIPFIYLFRSAFGQLIIYIFWGNRENIEVSIGWKDLDRVALFWAFETTAIIDTNIFHNEKKTKTKKKAGGGNRQSITTGPHIMKCRECAAHAHKHAFNVINIIKTVSFVRWDRSIPQSVFSSNCERICVCAHTAFGSPVNKRIYSSILMSSLFFRSLALFVFYTLNKRN